MSEIINKCMSELLKEMFSTSIAIVILVASITTLLEISRTIPNTWIEPIITFTTEWLFSSYIRITKFTFIFLGISGFKYNWSRYNDFNKNVFGD